MPPHTTEGDAVSLGHLTASSPSPSPDLRPVPLPIEGEHDKTSEKISRDDLGKRARRPNGRPSKSDGPAVSQRQSYLNARQRSPSPLVLMPPFQPSLPFSQGGMIRNLTGSRRQKTAEEHGTRTKRCQRPAIYYSQAQRILPLQSTTASFPSHHSPCPAPPNHTKRQSVHSEKACETVGVLPFRWCCAQPTLLFRNSSPPSPMGKKRSDPASLLNQTVANRNRPALRLSAPL
ncbi:uncharacterized protein BDZ83DRAFT_176218 [Colletotrichum acutatum]|uniref:Uncharacterized protein n=1 Tax=Glomerella acutata TaxID=27357 RepID=A0AAD8UA37_GLOAC|nr:uncharacterized protein BDZ83DRAFT_176218 [Colletotrichum acutatum]KAK1707512.1 hypothetical protein BDZ83DRAFT_176218 [Colletotrichum acutatum]